MLEPSLRASFLYIYGIPLDICFLLRGSGADEVETMLLTTRKAFSTSSAVAAGLLRSLAASLPLKGELFEYVYTCAILNSMGVMC